MTLEKLRRNSSVTAVYQLQGYGVWVGSTPCPLDACGNHHPLFGEREDIPAGVGREWHS